MNQVDEKTWREQPKARIMYMFVQIIEKFFLEINKRFPTCVQVRNRMERFHKFIKKPNETTYHENMTMVLMNVWHKETKPFYNSIASYQTPALWANTKTTPELVEEMKLRDKWYQLNETEQKKLTEYVIELNKCCCTYYNEPFPVPVPVNNAPVNQSSSSSSSSLVRVEQKQDSSDDMALNIFNGLLMLFDMGCKLFPTCPVLQQVYNKFDQIIKLATNHPHQPQPCLNNKTPFQEMEQFIVHWNKVLSPYYDKIKNKEIEYLFQVKPSLPFVEWASLPAKWSTLNTENKQHIQSTILQINLMITVYIGLPKKTLHKIHTITNQLVENMQSGNFDIKNFDLYKIGQEFAKDISEEDGLQLLENFSSLQKLAEMSGDTMLSMKQQFPNEAIDPSLFNNVQNMCNNTFNMFNQQFNNEQSQPQQQQQSQQSSTSSTSSLQDMD